MLPRPWYERVQSIAGTPSVSGGASSRPSVKERWARASFARDSAVLVRVVGIGGSLAGMVGVTVLWAVAPVVFAAVIALAAAARGADVNAPRAGEVEKRWRDIRYADGVALDAAVDDKRAGNTLRAGIDAIGLKIAVIQRDTCVRDDFWDSPPQREVTIVYARASSSQRGGKLN